MVKFNEDSVERINLTIYEYVQNKFGLSDDEMFDYEDFNEFVLCQFEPYYNSERNYN